MSSAQRHGLFRIDCPSRWLLGGFLGIVGVYAANLVWPEAGFVRTILAAPAATQPASAPVDKPATIAGRISAEKGKPLPEMVVYLESLDAKAKFPVPKTVAKVSQKDAKFSPSLVVISVGQSVDFTNDEGRPIEHNVFSRSAAKAFDLGLYQPGSGAKPVTFDTPGAVRLFCSIHRYMDGVVYVCPTPFFAVVNADGTYRIENVPPGDWRLTTWQRTARYVERSVIVRVAGGQVATEDIELSRK